VANRGQLQSLPLIELNIGCRLAETNDFWVNPLNTLVIRKGAKLVSRLGIIILIFYYILIVYAVRVNMKLLISGKIVRQWVAHLKRRVPQWFYVYSFA